MNTDWKVINKLSHDTRPMIEGLAKRGWQFRDGSWESGHNGDEYDDVEFKSPNMTKFASIAEREWREVTEEYLLEREAGHVGHEWASNVFHYTSVITNPLSGVLAKYFRKKKNASFAPLYSSSAEFKVKISPKIKDKPKKIKITIEIS